VRLGEGRKRHDREGAEDDGGDPGVPARRRIGDEADDPWGDEQAKRQDQSDQILTSPSRHHIHAATSVREAFSAAAHHCAA